MSDTTKKPAKRQGDRVSVDEEKLKSIWGTMSIRKMAEHLEVSIDTVRARADKLGLVVEKKRGGGETPPRYGVTKWEPGEEKIDPSERSITITGDFRYWFEAFYPETNLDSLPENSLLEAYQEFIDDGQLIGVIDYDKF